METSYWAKIFLILGLVFIVVGVLLLIVRIPGINKLGRLPGDIVYRRGNFVFYFPFSLHHHRRGSQPSFCSLLQALGGKNAKKSYPSHILVFVCINGAQGWGKELSKES